MNQQKHLILSCKAGNEEAFEELLRVYRPMMYYVYHKHYLPNIENQDFVQEASWLLFNATQKFSYEKGISFTSYYHRTLENFVVTCIRKSMMKRNVPFKQIEYVDFGEEKSALMHSFYTKKQTPEYAVLLNEKLEEYTTLLSDLERKVLNYWLNGQSFELISKKEGIDEPKVRRAYTRCRQKMRRILLEEV